MATTAVPVDVTSPQTHVREELLGLLNEIGVSNKFAAETSRTFSNAFFAGITVDGLGVLPMPMKPVVAAAVKPLCEIAPHGKGLKTVFDTSVRRAFQIDSTKVTLSKPLQQAVQNMVEECMDIMGVHGKVQAVLYKLLFYESGGHFDWHRDTVRCLCIVLHKSNQGSSQHPELAHNVIFFAMSKWSGKRKKYVWHLHFTASRRTQGNGRDSNNYGVGYFHWL